jgi:peptidoglycan hydrolase-like protein with peptidoglycan-binding domain
MPDGVYGTKTKQAVVKFQLANNLKGDGIVGKMTREKMK